MRFELVLLPLVLAVAYSLPRPELNSEYVFLIPQIPKVQIQPTYKLQPEYIQAINEK